ncbi:MAG: response regulator [Symploca sp. SIO2C1]|nr:response regulator [Symploca sp. SIO2C1]
MIKGNILIVDDTWLDLIALTRTLTTESYKVRTAENGQIALKIAKLDPPELILLNISMPGMNGYQVCQHLKADVRTCEVPVIFISTLNNVVYKVKAFDVGGVDYIIKPWFDQEVCARIQNHLRIHRRKQLLIKQNALLREQNALLKDEIRKLESWQIRSFCISADLN